MFELGSERVKRKSVLHINASLFLFVKAQEIAGRVSPSSRVGAVLLPDGRGAPISGKSRFFQTLPPHYPNKQ